MTYDDRNQPKTSDARAGSYAPGYDTGRRGAGDEWGFDEREAYDDPEGSEGVGETRTRDVGQQAGRKARQGRPTHPGEAAIDRPAHPLPAFRRGIVDLDRYLERPKDRFKIFSAQQRRDQRKRIATGLLVAIAIVGIIIWAILSRNAA